MRARTFLAMLEKTFLMAGERITGGPEEDEHRANIMVTAFIPNSSIPNFGVTAFKKKLPPDTRQLYKACNLLPPAAFRGETLKSFNKFSHRKNKC